MTRPGFEPDLISAQASTLFGYKGGLTQYPSASFIHHHLAGGSYWRMKLRRVSKQIVG